MRSLSTKQVNLIKRFEIFSNNISVVHRCIKQLKNEVMKRCSLTGSQGIYLAYLILYKDGLTGSQLAEIVGADKAEVSRAFKVLYDKGYICYPDFHGTKRYNTTAMITDKAREMMVPVIDEICRLIDEISLTNIDEEHRTIMYRALRTTAGNIKKCIDEKCEEERNSTNG